MTAPSPCGLSRTLKTTLPSASRDSSIDQEDRRRTGVRVTSNDRTPVSAKATSQRTYIKAICEVLDQYPGGLEKEQILEEVGRYCTEWFPDRSLETVRAGLQSTFSAQAKSKDPKVCEWAVEVPQDDAASKKRIWIRAGVHPQTTARPASAYRHQLSDSPAGGPRSSTIPISNSQLSALPDARIDSLPVSDRSDTLRHNETFYGYGSMQVRNSAEEQAPLHLWRAATQDSTLNESTVSLEESANLSQPRDVSTPGHRDERIVEDPREPRGSEPVTRYLRASSVAAKSARSRIRFSADTLGKASETKEANWISPEEYKGKEGYIVERSRSLQRRRKELLGHAAELEQKVHEARKQADETEQQYEHLQVEGANLDTQAGGFETDIRKIDVALLE
ncbi:hypothetical protein LTR91_021514 [Friedmanniomyces endolithicus]|uniref:Uncharacterized protein n=1 Tax=Friedmanniomyces endolithicus TaxID=329885 RepID=A0AAN6H7W2_9PEZI|nr:hypothetical protein LTR94_019242 [Friedmanniomyces endolithicus]KAK0772352.1 hypothetical protein LTR59_015714 [Friedmanniomyces endolithicus]KAK0775794.1 hypothetical protein LTR38_015740 [Friedmanniomyces endolithicus]KAK0779531.1 hypothetical protein LTR75_015321 [Friedmanniomyces endolithicus]KAK0826619.1 hypothetical protein LTR03_017098 [Friedmanniomyces endolithicus]